MTLALPDELLSEVIRMLRKTEWLCAAVLVNRRWHGLASYWRLWRTPFRARFPAASLPAPPHHPHTTTCHPTWPGPDVGLATGRGRSASCLGGHCGPDIVVRGSAVLSHNHNYNGNVVEWRAELVANARRVHERWMTNQRKLLWSHDVPSLYKPSRESSRVAPRDGKVCFARIAIESYQMSYVLVLYANGKRDWRTLPSTPRALCWPSDDTLFLLHESELTLMDVRTLDDIKTVAVDSTRQFELLSVDPVSQLACLAGPLGLSCVDHRVGTQVGQVGWDEDSSVHFLGLGGRTNPNQLCVVGHRRAALWDLRKLGQQLDCLEPAHAATKYRCAALHDGTLLLTETTAQEHTFHSFDLAGGVLTPSSPFPSHHFLSRTLMGAAQAPFRVQFDRYKWVLGLGDSWAVVDRRSGRVSESFPLAAPAAKASSSGSGGGRGGPYDLVYHNDTLVTSTSSHLMLWDYFTEESMGCGQWA